MAITVGSRIWGPALFKRRQVKRVGLRRRRPISFSAVLWGVCLVCLALLHVWLRLQVVHLGYVLSTTSKLENQLEQESLELKVELATLSSPQRLEKMARARLGLKEPEKGQVVILP